MDIIIEEEKHIPDFVVNGDISYRDDGLLVDIDDFKDDDDGLFWPDSDIDDDFDVLDAPNASRSMHAIDPGIIVPVGGGYFFAIGNFAQEKDKAMRRIKWMSVMTLVAVVSFVVGLLAAP